MDKRKVPVSLHFNQWDRNFDEHTRGTVLCSASTLNHKKQNGQFYIEHLVTDDASFEIRIGTTEK